MNTPRPARKPTSKPDKQIHQKQHHNHQQRHQPNILPPHLPPQPPTSHPKIGRRAAEPIRLINQQIDALPTLENPLDILRHDLAHARNLALHIPQRILLAGLRRPLRHHQLLQPRIERRAAVPRQRREVRLGRGKLRQEGVLDRHQEPERDPSSQLRLRDHEVGQPAGGGRRGVLGGGGGDVVDEVGAVGVGELLGLGVRDFGQDEGGEGGGLRGGGGGVLG